jgi:hypothetical protein
LIPLVGAFRHDSRMTDADRVDDAVHVATDKTKHTQDQISQRLEEHEVPGEDLTDEAVRRADDLETLAREAARDT